MPVSLFVQAGDLPRTRRRNRRRAGAATRAHSLQSNSLTFSKDYPRRSQGRGRLADPHPAPAPISVVVPKQTILYPPLQIAMCRYDQPDIDLARLGRADSRDQPSVSTCSSFACTGMDNSPAFQEERAFVRGLEQALTRAVGTGECAAVVAEQFAFQKRLGKGCAVDGNQSF